MCECISQIQNDQNILDRLNAKAGQKKKGPVVRVDVKDFGWFGTKMDARITVKVIGFESGGAKVADVLAVASFCPFCDEKYVKDQPQTEASGTDLNKP